MGLDQRRVGTIHTAQGREAGIVILVLGGGDQSGPKNWLAKKPKMVEMAVPHAKKGGPILSGIARDDTEILYFVQAIPIGITIQQSPLRRVSRGKRSMFVILLHYIKPFVEVDEYLEEHRKFLDKHYAAGHFLVSGAQAPRIGGVILAKNLSREELDAVLNEDPFHREQLATYQVIEFRPTKYAVGAEKWFS